MNGLLTIVSWVIIKIYAAGRIVRTTKPRFSSLQTVSVIIVGPQISELG